MSLILYVWILFSHPYDRPICSMWISQAPTQAVLASAGCVWTAEQVKLYSWRAVDYQTGQVLCERPASQLPVLTCDLWPLNHYVLRVYQPGYRKQLCYATLTHAGKPTGQDLLKFCPKDAWPFLDSDQVEWQFVASGPAPVPDPAPVICPMPDLTAAQTPSQAADLATHNNYQLLAYHLRWYYGTDANLDTWQNQLDPAIQQAGLAVKVPPRLLKGLIAQETQFWPVDDPVSPSRGEAGLGQLTDDGADLVLHYTPELFGQWCHVAIDKSYCARGYDLITDDQRLRVRDAFRAALVIRGTPYEAMLQARGQILTWALVLKAYYCAAGAIVGAVNAAPSWQFALAAYHSGPECVRGGEICPAGQMYVDEVERE